MTPYCYPAAGHKRRHGPAGYLNVESYRPWLRDEFSFRCVDCLEREVWTNLVASFEIDHFLPVTAVPEKRLHYDNLLYVCRACNAVKGSQRVPDPLKVLLSNEVAVRADGHLESRSREPRRLIDAMQLDRPAYVERRCLIHRIVTTSRKHDSLLYRMLLGFPQTLPDLSRLRPPTNSRRKGVHESFHAWRNRGELSEIY